MGVRVTHRGTGGGKGEHTEGQTGGGKGDTQRDRQVGVRVTHRGTDRWG